MPQIRWPTLTLLTLLPAALLAGLVGRYGVDVPYWDEWGLVDLFEKMHAHRLTWTDLSAQNNEHRIFFPRLIFLGLECVAGWRPRFEMFASVALATASGFTLLWLLRRTVSLNGRAFCAAALVINLLLFSPAQYENWLWGFQLAFFLVAFCMFAAIAVLCSSLSLPIKFLLAALCSFVATFSGGNGILLWPVLLVVLIARDERSRPSEKFGWIGSWLALAALAIGLYFRNYEKPAWHPPLAASSTPLDYICYLSAFIGSALGQYTTSSSLTLPVLFGASLLVLFCSLGATVALSWKNAALRRNAAPWLAIGAFAILNALLACIARIGFGCAQALESRYTTFSLPLAVAMVPLSFIIGRPRFLRLVPVVLALFFVATLPRALARMSQISERRTRGHLALLFVNLSPSSRLQASIFPDLDALTEYANRANALHLLRPPLFEQSDMNGLALPALAPSNRCGGLTSVTAVNEQQGLATGWARDPKTHRTPDGILLTSVSPDESRRFLALSFERFPRGKEWQLHFDRNRLRSGRETIEAWSLHAQSLSVCKLEGATVVE